MKTDLDHTEATGSERASQPSIEPGAAESLDHSNPYSLQLGDIGLDGLTAVRGGKSLHYVVGFLTGAATSPETLSWDDWLAVLSSHRIADDCDEDEIESDGEGKGPSVALLQLLFEQVQRRIADGALASLLPIASEADACDAWIAGLDLAVCQTLHELTDEEGEISARLFVREYGARAEQSRALARRSLAADVPRLVQLWREVPPYNPNEDKPQLAAPVEPPPVASLNTNGTFVRSGPKVGRNDPCTCGSGKKFKKCCG